MTEHKYSVLFREIKDMGGQYFDGRLGIETLYELARWIDAVGSTVATIIEQGRPIQQDRRPQTRLLFGEGS